MNKKRAGRFQQRLPRLGSLDGASAKSQDEILGPDQTRNGGVFAIAKRILSVSREDFGDASGRFGLDHVIHIHKTPAETSGYQRADSGFAGAHEPGQDNAANGRLSLGLGSVRQ